MSLDGIAENAGTKRGGQPALLAPSPGDSPQMGTISDKRSPSSSFGAMIV